MPLIHTENISISTLGLLSAMHICTYIYIYTDDVQNLYKFSFCSKTLLFIHAEPVTHPPLTKDPEYTTPTITKSVHLLFLEV